MSSQPNQSLADGLRCLQALAAAGGPVGGRELARDLGLHHVKANRMLMGLAAAGFAQRDEKGRYGAGPALHVLAALATFGSGLLTRALPQLRLLQQRSGATVALGVRWQRHVCYLYHGHAGTAPEQALGRTQLHPVSTSSIGLALLASSPPTEVAALYDADNPPTGFASPRALQAELKRIAKAGYACLEHGQAPQAHHSLAVTVGDPVIAGLACTGLPLDRPIETTIDHLHAAAEAIAATGAPA
jgi:DNA-binding IclR family transcriptional regulator